MTAIDYSILIAGGLLLGFLAWNEWRRTNRKRLGMRLFASLVAVASLVVMILPAINPVRNARMIAGDDVILLSKGFDRDSVNRFLSQQKTNTRILSLEPMKPYPVFQGALAHYVTGQSLPDSIRDAKTVHLFGFGLPTEMLTRIAAGVVFHPSPLPPGVVSVDWPGVISAGETVRVQGFYRDTSRKEKKLLLRGFGTVVDSVTIPAGKENTSFNLKTAPLHLGRAVFDLAMVDGTDTIEQGPIPLVVNAIKPLRMMLLSSSPRFENRFLKNWLQKSRYIAIARTYISKNKYQREFINRRPVNFDRVTPSLLDSTDLVIADAQELVSMPPAELSTLRVEIRERGMGMIVLADSVIRNDIFLSSFFSVKLESNQGLSNVLNWRGGSRRLAPGSRPYIVQTAGTQSLAVNTRSQVFASSALYGQGKIVLSTIDDSYSWALEGDDRSYAEFWSMLISKCARKLPPAFQNLAIRGESYVDEESAVDLEWNGDAPPRVEIDSAVVSFAQDPWLPYLWNGRYWPRKAGWQKATAAGDSSWVFTHTANDWATRRAARSLEETRRYLSGQETRRKSDITNPSETNTFFLAPWLLLLLFLGACGYLWGEKKYTGVS